MNKIRTLGLYQISLRSTGIIGHLHKLHEINDLISIPEFLDLNFNGEAYSRLAEYAYDIRFYGSYTSDYRALKFKFKILKLNPGYSMLGLKLRIQMINDFYLYKELLKTFPNHKLFDVKYIEELYKRYEMYLLPNGKALNSGKVRLLGVRKKSKLKNHS